MKKLLARDHEMYKSVSSGMFFDKGTKVLYKVTGMSLQDNKNYNDLYVYDLKSNFSSKLTTDGKTGNYLKYDDLSILVQRKNDKKTNVNKIDIITGEETKLFSLDYNIERLVKIDCENYIFTSKYNTLFDRNEFSVKAYEDGTQKSKLLDEYYYFDELNFRSNGEGIVNGERVRLYVYNTKSGVVEIISDPELSVGAFDYRNNEIVYTTIDTTKPTDATMSVSLYNLNTRKTDTLLNSGVYGIYDIHCLETGIIFRGFDTRVTHLRENAKMYALNSNKVDLIYADTMDINKSGASDVKLATGNKILKITDKLYLTFCNDGKERLANIDTTGHIEYLSDEFDYIGGFDIYKNKTIIELMTDTMLTELYLLENGKKTKLTFHNDKFLNNINISPTDVFTYYSNNHNIKGYVIKPVNMEEGKQYPGVLFIHGGPRGLYSKIYHHRMQVLANEGYFCFFTNPHGSASRGNEFSSIFGKHGETDYEDLMVFTDNVIERYPQLDKDRLGVTGHSYGGIMTNHIITKTNKFKAAVSSASLSNFTTKAFATDNGVGASMHVYGDPIENQEWTWNHSPLKNSNKVTTPTLFLHSDEDYRCSFVEAIQMYTALKRYGVDTAMYLFKGEPHSLKKPRNKVKWLEAMLNWFEKYLKSN